MKELAAYVALDKRLRDVDHERRRRDDRLTHRISVYHSYVDRLLRLIEKRPVQEDSVTSALLALGSEVRASGWEFALARVDRHGDRLATDRLLRKAGTNHQRKAAIELVELAIATKKEAVQAAVRQLFASAMAGDVTWELGQVLDLLLEIALRGRRIVAASEPKLILNVGVEQAGNQESPFESPVADGMAIGRPTESSQLRSSTAAETPLPSSSPGPVELDGNSYLAPRSLAEHYDLSLAALNGRLNRWRQKHAAGDDYVEQNDRKPKQPKFIYRCSAIRPIVEDLLQKKKANSG